MSFEVFLLEQTYLSLFEHNMNLTVLNGTRIILAEKEVVNKDTVSVIFLKLRLFLHSLCHFTFLKIRLFYCIKCHFPQL